MENENSIGIDEEHYQFAFIKETNPFRYLGSLVFSTVKGGGKPRKNPCVNSSCEHRVTWESVLSTLLLKVLLFFAKPVEKLGTFIEDCLNFIFAKDGFRLTLLTSLFKPGALTRLRSEDHRYYSFIGFLDPRQDLYRDRLEDTLKGAISAAALESDVRDKLAADLCMMASKLAYENKGVIKSVVNDQWKMHFVGFFDCWNEYLECRTTQAFIFTGKERDANAVVVAFRGTQPFNMYDWCTDFDFSYYVLPGTGRVHVGFLEALGLGSRSKKETFEKAKKTADMKAAGRTTASTPTSGLAQGVVDDSSKVLAYDAICAKLRVVLRENLGAHLYITGHSLGGALAALFSGLLLWEKENLIVPRVEGVFTFGQPRVGDDAFASYVEKRLCSPDGRKYFRVVYCNDLVPRVPFDDPLFQFKHIAPCHYYRSPSEAKAVLEEPNKNVYSLVFLPSAHVNAIWELIGGLRRRIFYRPGNGDPEETVLCLLVRVAGLVVPGLAAHNPANYVDAVRLAPATFQLPVQTWEEVSADWASTMGGTVTIWSRLLWPLSKAA